MSDQNNDSITETQDVPIVEPEIEDVTPDEKPESATKASRKSRKSTTSRSAVKHNPEHITLRRTENVEHPHGVRGPATRTRYFYDGSGTLEVHIRDAESMIMAGGWAYGR